MSQFIDFGTGREGSLNISATSLGGIPGFGVATVTGTAGQSSCVKADVGYFNGSNGGRDGDMVFIHQSQGTGVGQWEVNYITSTSGTTVNLRYPLTYTYVTGAQMHTSPQLYNGTISGNLSTSGWGGSWGGIIFLVDKGTLTINGTISANGGNGISVPGNNHNARVTGGGYRGGMVDNYNNDGRGTGQQGESYNADGGYSKARNHGGGGGADFDDGGAENWSAAGGAHATNGGNSSNTNQGHMATGGLAYGAPDFSVMFFGSGGGGNAGSDQAGDIKGSGGNGGGIIVIIAKNINVVNTIYATGGWGGGNPGKPGGSGAGGSILIKCQNGTLGTNHIVANGGPSTMSDQQTGGAGGAGRIHIDYLIAYTGTTLPAINATNDTSLKSQVYSGMI